MDESMLEMKEKVSSLYKFIKELILLKSKTVLNVEGYEWYKSFSDIPEDNENITVYYKDFVINNDNNNDSDSSVILTVHKPEFEACPQPTVNLRPWINGEWNSFKDSVNNIEYRILNKIGLELKGEEREILEERVKNGELISDVIPDGYHVEYFNDDESRVEEYNQWIEKRNIWQKRQITIDKTRKLFVELYQWNISLNRDSETLEMVVANGFVKEKSNNEINQAVLTKRVRISYDALDNTIVIEDTDDDTNLYSALFQEMNDVNLDNMNLLREKISNNYYHPLDRNETSDYLKEMAHYLSGESLFSEDGIPDDWDKDHKLLMYLNPSFIIRKRQNGSPQAIDAILESIENGGIIPSPLKEIVGGGVIEVKEDDTDISIQEQLAEVGGESVDVLLSKEADKEQLDIARRIEHYNAVLVQGPPGTGKTHTIANLMGHFLAQGKTVLATSQTKKALSVLKEKIDEELQTLCVSTLDDSNQDMEKAVDGIAEHIADYTSAQLKRLMDEKATQRQRVIEELADTRVKLFNKLKQEYSDIEFDGDKISPIDAAEFVLNNENELSYIPGKVKFVRRLPITLEELEKLYRSNEGISESDEAELSQGLPNPQEILDPLAFSDICKELKTAKDDIADLSNECNWNISIANGKCQLDMNNRTLSVTLSNPKQETRDRIEDVLSSVSMLESWMIPVISDGRKGGAYKQRWELLINSIIEVCDWDESIDAEKFGKKIEFNIGNIGQYKDEYQKILDKGSKPGKLQRKLDKKIDEAISSVAINGSEPETLEDFVLIKHYIERQTLRDNCEAYWNELFNKSDIKLFNELDEYEPEKIARNFIEDIQWSLTWFEKQFAQIQGVLQELGISEQSLFVRNKMDNDDKHVEEIIKTSKFSIPKIFSIVDRFNVINDKENIIRETRETLSEGNRYNSKICEGLLNAISNMDPVEYQQSFNELKRMYDKYELSDNRDKWLAEIYEVAPEWSDAIRNRIGIHGKTVLPENIADAWKWKQFNAYISYLTADSADQLQQRSLEYSAAYRKVTAEYSRLCAWYHLIKRTEKDISLRQNLSGWKQTQKAIGKGKGKRAPALKKEARAIMTKCQEAVPAWIMPINKVLESFDPANNTFDVIIIDEASQADLSALAVLYMGKKLIIVGDDKQVSPISIGQEVDKVEALQAEYIKDKIPNGHLYDGNRSIYDVAMTTFQPLMLKEHFRCVPDIIGFSNELSYDFKIKPLRDAGTSKLLPAVVNHRVENGLRDGGKTNTNEAKEIVALIKACIEQKEYKGKTIGVISLLGNEQAKLIRNLIFENIDIVEIENRKILCGDAASFQGDERDVIFLSLVDSNESDGPLFLREYGVGEELRKRYNVATSRARDQLWVVHSLDPIHDLKPRDIRKRLIEYAINPKAVENRLEKVQKESESPFEESVAKALIARGYDIHQQYPVGGYRLDIVVKDKNKQIVIECDGERYHSGEEKVREDMERQTILERIGWRFIRIRGSEYYRNPDKTMEKVFEQLSALEIEPDNHDSFDDEAESSELLDRVLDCAGAILADINLGEQKNPINISTIAAALNEKASFGTINV